MMELSLSDRRGGQSGILARGESVGVTVEVELWDERGLCAGPVNG